MATIQSIIETQFTEQGGDKVVGKVNNLEAANRKLEGSSGKASGGIAGLAASFGKFLPSATGVATTVLAVAAALGTLVVKSIATAGALVDTADSMDLTTGSLQTLRATFELSGTSTEKADAALTQFALRLGEARQGTGPLQAGLQGVNSELLNNLRNATSTEAALGLVADAMQKATTQTERNVLGQLAFGKGSAKMTTALKEGSDGMNKQAEEARALGLVLSESLLRNADRVGDRFGLLSSALGSLFTDIGLRIVSALTPALDQIADKIEFLLKQAHKLVDSLLPEKLENLSIATLQDKIEEQNKIFQENIKMIRQIEQNAQPQVSRFEDRLRKNPNVPFGGRENPPTFSNFSRLTDPQATVDQATLTYRNAATQALLERDKLQAALDPKLAVKAKEDLAAALATAAQADALVKSKVEEVIKSLNQEREALGLDGEALATYNALQKAGIDSNSRFAQSVTDSAVALERAKEQKKVSSVVEDLKAQTQALEDNRYEVAVNAAYKQAGITAESQYATEVRATAVALESAKASKELANEATRNATQFEEKLNSSIEAANDVRLTEQQRLDNHIESLYREAEALGLSATATDELKGKIEELRESQQKNIDASEKFSVKFAFVMDDAENALTELTRKGQLNWRTFVTELLAQANRLLIIRPILQSLATGIDSLQESGFFSNIFRGFGGAAVAGAAAGTAASAGEIGTDSTNAIYASGGSVKHFAAGGSSLRDRVPALLEPGEFVMRRQAVRAHGIDTMERMNAGFNQSPKAPVIHIHNEGTPQEQGKAPQVTMDVEKMVIDIWTRDFQNNGQTRQTLKKGLR